MKKMLKIVIFILLTINVMGTSIEKKIKYKDITPEHWAYKAIENLYKKGILDINSDLFNGEKTVNRYDLASFLSKTLDRVENVKADRADLIVLEHIVYEFSEELSKFGFDSKTYLLKVDSFESRLQENKISAEGNKADLIKVETRLSSIEKELSRKNQFLGQGDSFTETRLKYFDNFNLYLKSNIDYTLNDTDNSFKGAQKLGLSFKKENYELFLESETSDKEKKNGELLVKGQINNEILKGYTLNFHTVDYERYYKSHFNNVIYDNHNSYSYTTDSGKEYQYDYFDSYGLALVNENMGIFLEKTRSDYEDVFSGTEVEGVTVDKAFSDTFNFIGKFNYKYFDSLILKNGNNDNLDFEITGKYPIKKIELSTAYSQKIGTERSLAGEFNNGDLVNYKYNDLKFLNAEIVYGGKSNLTFGLESKFNETDKLYTAYYGSYKYNLTDNGKIKYKYEYINRDKAKGRKDFENHYFVINIFGEKINTYGSYSIIDMNKKYYYTNNQNENYYADELNFNETLLKSTYKINDKALAKIGYLLRKYKNQTNKKEISFAQAQYNMDENTHIFIKYIKNTGDDFNDRKLDIDNNMIDLDFDTKTGVIRSASDGRIEFGIELVF